MQTTTDDLTSRTRINPTTVDELRGRWILTRNTSGQVAAEYISEARFNYEPGYRADLLLNAAPTSLWWRSQPAAAQSWTVTEDFELGDGLLLASNSEVQDWITGRIASEEATQRHIDRLQGVEPRTQRAADMRSATCDLWAPRAALHAAHLNTLTEARS